MEVCYLWLEVSVLKPDEVTRLFITVVFCVRVWGCGRVSVRVSCVSGRVSCVWVSSFFLHTQLSVHFHTQGRAPLTKTCAATPSLPLVRKKASRTACGRVPGPPPAVSIAPSSRDSIWSAVTGARRSRVYLCRGPSSLKERSPG